MKESRGSTCAKSHSHLGKSSRSLLWWALCLCKRLEDKHMSKSPRRALPRQQRAVTLVFCGQRSPMQTLPSCCFSGPSTRPPGMPCDWVSLVNLKGLSSLSLFTIRYNCTSGLSQSMYILKKSFLLSQVVIHVTTLLNRSVRGLWEYETGDPNESQGLQTAPMWLWQWSGSWTVRWGLARQRKTFQGRVIK